MDMKLESPKEKLELILSWINYGGIDLKTHEGNEFLFDLLESVIRTTKKQIA